MSSEINFQMDHPFGRENEGIISRICIGSAVLAGCGIIVSTVFLTSPFSWIGLGGGLTLVAVDVAVVGVFGFMSSRTQKRIEESIKLSKEEWQSQFPQAGRFKTGTYQGFKCLLASRDGGKDLNIYIFKNVADLREKAEVLELCGMVEDRSKEQQIFDASINPCDS